MRKYISMSDRVIAKLFSDDAEYKALVLARFLIYLDVIRATPSNGEIESFGCRVAEKRMMGSNKRSFVSCAMCAIFIIVLMYLDFKDFINRLYR